MFPFLAPIFCCLYRILAFKVAEENKEKNLDLFFILFIEASYLIGGLLYFISPVGSMKEKNKTTRLFLKEQNHEFAYNDGSKKSQIKIMMLISLISLLITLYIICTI